MATLRRAEELKMDEIHLRVRNKLARYESIKKRRGLEDDQICYIGDDVLDLQLRSKRNWSSYPNWPKKGNSDSV